VVRPEQAGAGSAVNDATRQVGGTLGAAAVGLAAAFFVFAVLPAHPSGRGR
jgi:hypothetical protein